MCLGIHFFGPIFCVCRYHHMFPFPLFWLLAIKSKKQKAKRWNRQHRATSSFLTRYHFWMLSKIFSYNNVSSVFWLLILQFKFLGTIKFLVSILDLKYSNLPPPFAPCKISPINLWKPHVRNHFVSMIYHFLFSLLITPCC
jgi:hypothetical protein